MVRKLSAKAAVTRPPRAREASSAVVESGDGESFDVKRASELAPRLPG
jgi:hypothetical protein